MHTTVIAAPPQRGPMADGKLLFCPFCRECYEGETRCPEHDLPLVEFAALPKAAHEVYEGDDDPVHMLEVGRGRLLLAVASLGLLVGFLVPFIQVSHAGQTEAFTGLAAATRSAANLWSIPIAGAFFGSLLLRRRTPRQMRSARLASAFVAFVPVVSLAYSLRRVVMAAAIEGQIEVSFRAGVYVVFVSSVVALAGSLRFGGPPSEHGSAPSSPDLG